MTVTAATLDRLGVDRDSPLWLRLRSACQHGASYIDLDVHTDRVYRTLCDRVGRSTDSDDGLARAIPAGEAHGRGQTGAKATCRP